MATSNKDSGYVDNWQAGKTVIECNLHMLTSEDCSDVTFRVGSGKHVIRAHRYVLVSRSCVFNAMFCGPLAEKGEVTIPDIESAVFREFLRYLYTDTATLTADNVTGLLYTSRKYAVDALQDMCVTCLEKSLSDENVCQILEHCHGYGETDLEQKALTILTEAGVKVIKSPAFLELCSDCLEKFVQSRKLKLKEAEVFEAVMSWTKETCNEEGISFNPENIRKRLGELRHEVRFTEFSLEYLVNVVGPSGILTNDERIKIIDRVVNKNTDISPFKLGPRRQEPASLSTVQRFASKPSASSEDLWVHSGEQEAVSFAVNKNITLVGCQLHGPCNNPESTYTILDISILDEESMINFRPIHNMNCLLRGDNYLTNIFFPDPVPLVSDHTYHIIVCMCGDATCWGCDGQPSVTVDGVTFTFTDSVYSEYTSCSAGQIPGLIWK